MTTPAPHWTIRLNSYFKDDLKIEALPVVEPIIQIKGALELTGDQEHSAQACRLKLTTNDAVAILTSDPDANQQPITLEVHTCDYAAVCALDEAGHRPTMLSGATLLLCSETEQLVIHRRSMDSRDYPGALHVFGGAYRPPQPGLHLSDGLHLINTAVRETREESGILVNAAELPPLLLIREKIGFLQLGLAGVDVTRQQLLQAEHNSEGRVELIHFLDLEQRLRDQHWLPAGKALILAWLALGGKTSGGRTRKGPARFGPLTAQQVFENLVP